MGEKECSGAQDDNIKLMMIGHRVQKKRLRYEYKYE